MENLLYTSRMAAKVDNSAVQDGFSLYHHVIAFDDEGNWTVVQQRMNRTYRMARRYHWISDSEKFYFRTPRRHHKQLQKPKYLGYEFY